MNLPTTRGSGEAPIEPQEIRAQIEHEVADLLVEEAPEALIALSQEGAVIFWNHGAEKLFGVSSADAMGRPFVELAVPAEEREQSSAAIARAVSLGTATLTTRPKANGGSNTPVEALLRCVRDEVGKLRFVSVMVRDPQELRRLHEAQATEAKFRGLLEAAPDAMVIVRGDRTIALVNGQLERMFGYGREELLGKPIEVLIPERFRESHVKYRDRYYAEPRTRPMGAGLDLFGRKKDGAEFPVEISLSPMQTAEGMLVTAAIRDITERKLVEMERLRSEEAIRKLNKELEAFSYSVSHDLRAPLRAIDGFSQVLLEDYADKLDGQGRDHLGRIRQASQRMAQLIDDLLALSRINRTELRQLADVDLSELGRVLAADLTERDPSRRVIWEIAPGLVAKGDPHLLRIVLANLLDNAWKFTRHAAAAAIAVGSREVNGERVFFVKDNGVGFDMAYASKLFSPFQRLHSQTEFEGTGIGLVTVQRIVHRHGGRIWVESTPGEGATFFFTLGGGT